MTVLPAAVHAYPACSQPDAASLHAELDALPHVIGGCDDGRGMAVGRRGVRARGRPLDPDAEEAQPGRDEEVIDRDGLREVGGQARVPWRRVRLRLRG